MHKLLYQTLSISMDNLVPGLEKIMSALHRSQNTLQSYLRLPDQMSYTPDSHRFVNHTDEVQKVFERLLEMAPRNKRIWGDERISTVSKNEM